MPTATQFVAFVVASVLLVVVPGPSVVFAIGRALTVGRRGALLAVAGNALGLLVQVACVAIGLGALVAASTTASTVLKLVGAAYVVYLGVQAIRHRSSARLALAAPGSARAVGLWRGVWAGFVVGMTNPKSMVFFVAFLPQFLNQGAPATPQLLVLGVLFGVLAASLDSIWALAAGQAREWFARRPERLDRLGVAGGVTMIGLGTGLAVEGATAQ